MVPVEIISVLSNADSIVRTLPSVPQLKQRPRRTHMSLSLLSNLLSAHFGEHTPKRSKRWRRGITFTEAVFCLSQPTPPPEPSAQEALTLGHSLPACGFVWPDRSRKAHATK